MEISSTVLDAEAIELKEALRVVAVAAASRPELILRERSDRILPMLCVDQLSAEVIELALEIL
jgi:hypothetical protein